MGRVVVGDCKGFEADVLLLFADLCELLLSLSMYLLFGQLQNEEVVIIFKVYEREGCVKSTEKCKVSSASGKKAESTDACNVKGPERKAQI